MTDTDFPSVCVLGSRVHLPTREQALNLIESWIRARDPCRQVVVTGFHGLWEAHKDPELKEALNAAALWVPDGIAPVWVARLRGHRHVQRLPGAELMTAFLERADRQGYSSFFFGDTPEQLAALRAAVERRYPGHRVAGLVSPPFRPPTAEEDAEHVRLINESGADILWVGLGTPKQDRWIAAHLARLHVPVAAGVGAAFGFLSGATPRAPAWMGRAGLEWAWRLLREPRKCWRRSLIEGPCFLFHVLLELCGLRQYDTPRRERRRS